MIEILKPEFEFADERGSLVQLVSDGYKQVNVTSAIKGCKRGGHYHKINQEAFYIIKGELSVILRKDGREEKYGFSAGDMFLIKHSVVHDFVFIEDTLFISMYDKGVEISATEKDIHRG